MRPSRARILTVRIRCRARVTRVDRLLAQRVADLCQFAGPARKHSQHRLAVKRVERHIVACVNGDADAVRKPVLASLVEAQGQPGRSTRRDFLARDLHAALVSGITNGKPTRLLRSVLGGLGDGVHRNRFVSLMWSAVKPLHSHDHVHLAVNEQLAVDLRLAVHVVVTGLDPVDTVCGTSAGSASSLPPSARPTRWPKAKAEEEIIAQTKTVFLSARYADERRGVRR